MQPWAFFRPPVPPVPLSVWSTEYVILQSGSTTEYYSHQNLPIPQHDADYYYGVLPYSPEGQQFVRIKMRERRARGREGEGQLRRGKARKGTSCKRDDDDDDYSVLLTLTHGTPYD